MSKKITIDTLDAIKFLVREDSFMILTNSQEKSYNPLSGLSSHYEEGTIILMGPQSKPKIEEKPQDKSLEENQYKINVKDKILFDDTNSLIIHIKNSHDRYVLINKRDILMVLSK